MLDDINMQQESAALRDAAYGMAQSMDSGTLRKILGLLLGYTCNGTVLTRPRTHSNYGRDEQGGAPHGPRAILRAWALAWLQILVLSSHRDAPYASLE